ncbi:MAG: rhodanese-like domain-containing protein [Propionibacteriaceae bacterium]
MPTDVPNVLPADVPDLLTQGWRLVDVRTDAEWAEGRIYGSDHIPLDQLIARLDEVAEKTIFVCAVGGRSAQATAYVVGQGREAVNLVGGVQAWEGEGRSLTAPEPVDG